MPCIYLVVGPVGAGKSTISQKLAQQHEAVFFNLDAWMTDLFRPDRPEDGILEWYQGRVKRCKDQIWKTSEDILSTGTDVVLEIGLITKLDRNLFYDWVSDLNADLKIYVVDAPREVRRERVLKRNSERGSTFSMEVPEEIFNLASDLWEPLDTEECSGRDVIFV